MNPQGYYALFFVLVGVILLLSVLTIPGSPSFPALSLNLVILYILAGFVGLLILRKRR